MMDQVVSILSEYLEIITVLFAMIFLVTITIFFTVIRTDIEKRISYTHKSGKTIVLVTHDKEIAGQCDQVIEIEDGRIIHE